MIGQQRMNSVADSNELIIPAPQNPYFQNLASEQNYPKCNLQCQYNEVCQLKNGESDKYECICPVEYGFYNINNVCREYLANTESCDNILSSCQHNNEECLSVDGYPEQKTCQCQIGFLRDRITLECIAQNSKFYYPKTAIMQDIPSDYDSKNDFFEKVSG